MTDEAALKAREKAIVDAFDGSYCFIIKPRWTVYSDSVHVELIKNTGSQFDELISILNKNTFLRFVTVWVSSGKQIKTTKHRKRLFWHGGEHISKQRAKDLLEQAVPVKNNYVGS